MACRDGSSNQRPRHQAIQVASLYTRVCTCTHAKTCMNTCGTCLRSPHCGCPEHMNTYTQAHTLPAWFKVSALGFLQESLSFLAIPSFPNSLTKSSRPSPPTKRGHGSWTLPHPLCSQNTCLRSPGPVCGSLELALPS